MSAFPMLPGTYNVRMRTYEGAEFTVEVKADSEADARGIAGHRHEGEALYAYFLCTTETEDD